MTIPLLTIPLPPFTLRNYQQESITDLRQALRNPTRRALLVMPTGAGKTATAADMMRSANLKGKRVLWLVDRIELIEQAAEAFERAGVGYSYVLPDRHPSKFASAWIGTIQTFLARVKSEDWLPATVDFLVIDEAHRTESASYQTALTIYPDAYVVGLTATPIRGDGRGLGNSYGDLVCRVTTQQLLDQGYLVPPRYYIPSELDLRNVRTKRSAAHDYTKEEWAQIVKDNPQLIGDAVETFARVCPDRRAVAFPATIAQSLGLRDQFNEAGIPACHIDATTPAGERKALMADFRAGLYQVLTSVNIAIEGLDVPDVSCVIMLRPTKSLRIWIQAVGRGLRSYPGKTDCVVLDHCGVLTELGPAEADQDWSLDYAEGRGSKKAPAKKRKGDKVNPKEISCEACSAVFFKARICPDCGHEHLFERAPSPIRFAKGELSELTDKGPKAKVYTAAEKAIWYAMLLGVAQGDQCRASGMFMGKFGHWPARKDGVKAKPSTPEVLAYVTSSRIAWKARMKAQEKAAALAAAAPLDDLTSAAD